MMHKKVPPTSSKVEGIPNEDKNTTVAVYSNRASEKLTPTIKLLELNLESY